MPSHRHPIISDFLDYIQNVRRYSMHTLRSYAFDLDNFTAFCNNFDSKQEFLDLKQVVIHAYLQHLSHQGLHAKTLARRLASIKSLYKYMLKNNLVKMNISQGIKTPKIKKELPHFLSLKQAEKILTLPVGNDEKSLRERLILELFYATGVRITELITIRFRDIRLEEGIIHVMGKGNKERLVIIGNETTNVLRKYLNVMNENNNKYLFPALRIGRNGKKGSMSTKAVFNIVKKYLKIISNDETLSPHSLRHTFATHMLDNGADIMAIKDLLGHNSLSSTQVYTHLQSEKLKKIYEQAHPHAK